MLGRRWRAWLVAAHLWLALVFGSVFVVLGMTGSIIAWMPELDRWVNPGLFKVTPAGSAVISEILPQQVQAALDKLTQDPRYGRPSQLTIPESSQEVLIAWYRNPASHANSVLHQESSRQVTLDPTTLQIKGERQWGELGLTAPLLLPTLYHLHRYLLLAEAGKTIIAVSGWMLVLMCFSGLLLWLPKPKWQALRQAVSVNWRATWAAICFRLHRMAGFFALPVLLLLGFSGSYFNKPQWVLPALEHISTLTPAAKVGNADPSSMTRIAATQAMHIAQSLYPQARVSRLGLPSSSSAPYEVRLRQSGELHTGDGATRVSIDAHSGTILRVIDPLRGTAGDRFLACLFPLHSGMAFGIAGRMFMSVFGLLPLLFFVTGLHMWRKNKRRSGGL